MNRRRHQHQSQNTFLQDNPGYRVKYYELHKEAMIWKNTGPVLTRSRSESEDRLSSKWGR